MSNAFCRNIRTSESLPSMRSACRSGVVSEQTSEINAESSRSKRPRDACSLRSQFNYHEPCRFGALLRWKPRGHRNDGRFQSYFEANFTDGICRSSPGKKNDGPMSRRCSGKITLFFFREAFARLAFTPVEVIFTFASPDITE